RPAHTLFPSAKQRPLPRAAILPPSVSIPLLKNYLLLQSAVLYRSAITSFLLSILVYSLVFPQIKKACTKSIQALQSDINQIAIKSICIFIGPPMPFAIDGVFQLNRMIRLQGEAERLKQKVCYRLFAMRIDDFRFFLLGKNQNKFQQHRKFDRFVSNDI